MRRLGRAQLLSGAAIVICLVLVFAAVIRSHQAEQSARAQAESFVPSPAASLPALQNLIEVIGDESTGAPEGASSTAWPSLLATGLHVPVQVSSGSGYTSSSDASQKTFGQKARDLDPSARVVVLFGGSADVHTARTVLVQAATVAIADVRDRCPSARIIVVAPILPRAPSQGGRASLAAESAVLRTAAGLAAVTFIDPISAKWFDSQHPFQADGTALSTTGQQQLAGRMRAILSPLITG